MLGEPIIYPPGPSLKLVTDIFEFCRNSVPGWNSISISGYHIRESGSTAVQEVAFTLANAIAYVEAALARGLEVDSFAPRLAFFFNCHNNFLEEIAKFRAARRLWAKIMKYRFKAKEPRSMMLRFHTQTAGSTLTAQQPLNNSVRTSVQALAAVLGGTQSLHTNSFDEALCLPTEDSALLALRTQQIIAHESGVADVVDPLGGSYTIERLTDEIETKASELIQTIDAIGGTVSAIEQGYIQREIEEAAYQYQRDLENQSQVIIGVNAFTQGVEDSEARKLRLLKVDPRLEQEQIERLGQLKASRNSAKHKAAMQGLENSLSEDRNLMPAVLEAIRAEASIGEISDSLRKKWGEYTT